MAKVSKWAAFVDVEKSLRTKGFKFSRATMEGTPVLKINVAPKVFVYVVNPDDARTALDMSRAWYVTTGFKHRRVGWAKDGAAKVAASIMLRVSKMYPGRLDGMQKAFIAYAAKRRHQRPTASLGAPTETINITGYRMHHRVTQPVALTGQATGNVVRLDFAKLTKRAETMAKGGQGGGRLAEARHDNAYLTVAREAWNAAPMTIFDARKLIEWALVQGKYHQYNGKAKNWEFATVTRQMSTKLGIVALPGETVLASPATPDDHDGKPVRYFLSWHTGWSTTGLARNFRP